MVQTGGNGRESSDFCDGLVINGDGVGPAIHRCSSRAPSTACGSPSRSGSPMMRRRRWLPSVFLSQPSIGVSKRSPPTPKFYPWLVFHARLKLRIWQKFEFGNGQKAQPGYLSNPENVPNSLQRNAGIQRIICMSFLLLPDTPKPPEKNEWYFSSTVHDFCRI